MTTGGGVGVGSSFGSQLDQSMAISITMHRTDRWGLNGNFIIGVFLMEK
ncbi:hypothetical protein C943_00752 [Mariniradius saccharolyticus AK6]|uniref:Uncharacterized protein n=1 Tax=Mariniradius saccharolyticus AK6 TaxID=1239962 RepID=M7XW83_9BACT|nr:hypothetical protein C943_00752 [Mariniradius saccharolyticus AK6]